MKRCFTSDVEKADVSGPERSRRRGYSGGASLRVDLGRLAVLFLLASAGCDGKPAPTVATGTPATAKPAGVSRDALVQQVDAAAAAAQPQAAEGTAAGEISQEAPAKPERLMVLTPSGPLLIDVRITLDGGPLGEGVDELIDQVLAAGRADGEGAPGSSTWATLVANESFLKSQFGGVRPPAPRERGSWAERYDLNHDGEIQRSEAAAWLGRDSGGAAHAFSLRSRRSYRPDMRAASRIWPLVDADGDGLASSDELHRTPAALQKLDANDDEKLTPAELVALRDQVTGAAAGSPASRTESTPYAAIHVADGVDIERLAYLLNDIYSPRQDLRPGSFGVFAALGKALDANADDWLEPDELTGLREASAHLELAVSFGNASGPGEPAETIRLLNPPAEAVDVSPAGASRLIVRVGDSGLVVTARDVGSAGPPTQEPAMPPSAVVRQRVRVMIHDEFDGLFQQLDVDHDCRLSAREIAGSSERLLVCDRDGDGQIGGGELPYVMVVAFLRGEAGDERSFYVPPPSMPLAADAEAPAWFRSADFNSDGDISRREFLGPADAFAALDRNRDGFVDEEEATTHH